VRDARLGEMPAHEGSRHAWERDTPGGDAHSRKMSIGKVGTPIRKISTLVREVYRISLRVACRYFAGMSPLADMYRIGTHLRGVYLS
jgi:hypothetical protein